MSWYRADRARRASIRHLAPLVQASRLRCGEIPPRAWLDPYLLGLVPMMITLLARTSSPALANESLAEVQARAWSELTGLDEAMLGEYLTPLCLSYNPQFEAGVQDAARLTTAILLSEADAANSPQAQLSPAAAMAPSAAAHVQSLWVDCIDHRLLAVFDNTRKQTNV